MHELVPPTFTDPIPPPDTLSIAIFICLKNIRPKKVKYGKERVVIEVVDICDRWPVDPGPDRAANFWGRSIDPTLCTCTNGRHAPESVTLGGGRTRQSMIWGGIFLRSDEHDMRMGHTMISPVPMWVLVTRWMSPKSSNKWNTDYSGQPGEHGKAMCL